MNFQNVSGSSRQNMFDQQGSATSALFGFWVWSKHQLLAIYVFFNHYDHNKPRIFSYLKLWMTFAFNSPKLLP